MTDPPGVHVVVGGASGIGAAVAAAEQKRGADVFVWDVAGDFDVECDVTDPAAVDAATAATLGQVGVPREVTVTAVIVLYAMLLYFFHL
jgi:NAD(P)-dependent dehydrogenase (short-subunit alcohol dehydrogenase family)